MALLDTVFMNFSLLSTGSTMFWFALVVGLIIWKNTKNVMTTLGVMAIMVPIFMIDAIKVNTEIMVIGIVLILILLIERFMVD